VSMVAIEVVKSAGMPLSPKAGTWEVLTVAFSKGSAEAEMSKTVFGDRSECELWLAARGLELGDKIDDAYGGVFSSWAVREVRT